MLDRCETLGNCTITIPLFSLKCVSFTVIFIALKIPKIGCVNYAHFTGSGCICAYVCTMYAVTHVHLSICVCKNTIVVRIVGHIASQ